MVNLLLSTLYFATHMGLWVISTRLTNTNKLDIEQMGVTDIAKSYDADIESIADGDGDADTSAHAYRSANEDE